MNDHIYRMKEKTIMGKHIVESEDLGELVRCKECVYSSYEPYKDQADVYVCNYSHWRRSEGGLFPDDFCSRAERRLKCD